MDSALLRSHHLMHGITLLTLLASTHFHPTVASQRYHWSNRNVVERHELCIPQLSSAHSEKQSHPNSQVARQHP